MDALKRKVGPFSVGVWLIIGAGGIALGLLLRKGFGSGKTDANDKAVVLDYAGDGSFVSGGGMLTNEEKMYRDMLDRLRREGYITDDANDGRVVPPTYIERTPGMPWGNTTVVGTGDPRHPNYDPKGWLPGMTV